jgi:hypothetical protein
VAVRTVFVFPNGYVAVGDEHGQQIPELQGRFPEVRDAILARSDEQTVFHGQAEWRRMAEELKKQFHPVAFTWTWPEL